MGSIIQRSDFVDEHGNTDWRELQAARIANGELCPGCLTVQGPTGTPRLCSYCREKNANVHAPMKQGTNRRT